MSNHPNRRKKPPTPTTEVTAHRIAQIAAGLDRVSKELARIDDLWPDGWMPSGREAISRLCRNSGEAARIYWTVTAAQKAREAGEAAATEPAPARLDFDAWRKELLVELFALARSQSCDICEAMVLYALPEAFSPADAAKHLLVKRAELMAMIEQKAKERRRAAKQSPK